MSFAGQEVEAGFRELEEGHVVVGRGIYGRDIVRVEEELTDGGCLEGGRGLTDGNGTGAELDGVDVPAIDRIKHTDE